MQAFLEGSQEVQFRAEGAGRDLRLGGPDVEAAAVRQAEPPNQGPGAALRRQDDGSEPGASDAADQPVCEDARGQTDGVSTTPVSTAVHDSGCGDAGRSRSGPRADEWAGDLRHFETRARSIRESAVPTAGGDLERAPVQFAQQCGLSTAAHRLHRHAPNARLNRGTTQADAGRPAGLCADRHGAPRRSRRSQGCVSHQPKSGSWRCGRGWGWPILAE